MIRKLIFILFFSLNLENLFCETNNAIIITVGNQPITRIDLIKEIKFISVLSNTEIKESNRDEIKNIAIRTLVKRTIKKNEIERLKINNYNKQDLELQVVKVASNLNLDKNGLKTLLDQHGLSYSDLVENFEVDLKWNTAIFKLYKNKIALNTVEIENKINEERKKVKSNRLLFLSEIQVNYSKGNLNTMSEKVLKDISEIGFANTAKKLSISNSAEKGGELGWMAEDKLSVVILEKIKNLQNGQISKPIAMNGTLIFIKKNDEKNVSPDLAQIKKVVVNQEKMKKLDMFSNSHYSDLEARIKVKFL